MEDTLREYMAFCTLNQILGLNPCFNGRYSQRNAFNSFTVTGYVVLILVLMEDTLRVFHSYKLCLQRWS